MPKQIRWRVILISVTIALGVFFVYPPQDKIRLGLDLKGGTHLRFEVNVEDAVRAEADQALLRLRDVFRENKWPYERAERATDRSDVLEITGIPSDENFAAIEKLLNEQFADWHIEKKQDGYALRIRSDVRLNIEEFAIRQAIDTMRNRVDEYGVVEPSIQREGMGGKRIVVQLPGVDDPERAKQLVKRTAYLEWKPMAGAEGVSKIAVMQQWADGVAPEGVQIIQGQDKKFYPVQASAVLTGRDLMNSRPTQDEMGLPAVSFTLNPEGAEIIKKYSADHIGDRIAILLDNVVLSAPVIRERLSASNIITGRFANQEAQDLAIQLRAGALPATLTDLEERTIGPSLGSDSIRKGVWTSIACLIIIFIWALIYYRLSGINIIVCLLLNLLLVLAVLGLFGATLTLPGVAGIVLTIGMAVDANILIFERIKEELRVGKSPRSAVSAGFDKAFSAIFDSNITTIIACVFLFQFGTGPIKGFATTMVVGLVANLFTAIFVSRTLFEWYLGPKEKRISQLSI